MQLCQIIQLAHHAHQFTSISVYAAGVNSCLFAVFEGIVDIAAASAQRTNDDDSCSFADGLHASVCQNDGAGIGDIGVSDRNVSQLMVSAAAVVT